MHAVVGVKEGFKTTKKKKNDKNKATPKGSSSPLPSTLKCTRRTRKMVHVPPGIIVCDKSQLKKG